jgi:hypothetical protein
MAEVPKSRIEIAPQYETQRREREIQLLINIVEPDPAYQPLLTDEANFLDAVGEEAEEIQRRLDCYFGVPLGLPLTLPLWRYVDEVKRLRPGWPDEPERATA